MINKHLHRSATAHIRGLAIAVALVSSLAACTTPNGVAASGATVSDATGSDATDSGATDSADPGGDGDDLVIYDNDWSASGATSVLPLLADPDVRVLGVTTVTGDAWATEGTADALSFLEQVGTPDIPVAQGQLYPLINTAQRTYAREQLYGGGSSWKGAFNPSDDDPTSPATTPDEVAEPPFGWAQQATPSADDAIDFMIDQVRAHPNEVTIITAGPLTNVAAAIRRDPEFAALAKGIVIGGGNLYQLSPGEQDPEFNSSEGFNFRFDPESAHIVLTAPWASITALGDVTSSVLFDDALMARVTSESTPASEYTATVGYVGYPIWDETVTAVAVHPELITQSIDVRMDVDISEGPNYGAARVWSEQDAPGLGEGRVTFVQAVDEAGVADAFVEANHAQLHG